MHIKTIRYGHANNSSSTHSLIFLGDRHVPSDSETEYGWNDFTLTSRFEKAMYLLMMLSSNLRHVKYFNRTMLIETTGHHEKFDSYHCEHLNEAETFRLHDTYVAENFGDLFTKEEIQTWIQTREDRYIDHQSHINLPFTMDRNLHIEFIKKYFGYILNQNFAILGGNDNSDGHPMQDEHVETPFSNMVLNAYNYGDYQRAICVYDDLNDDYILSRENGDKIRICFDIENRVTEKSKYPELVDLKITNFCAYGCAFCYQSSTQTGEHAPFERIKSITKILRASNCMEVAIGGGEPTTHPRFGNILQELHWQGMKVGFTTRNFNIVDHGEINFIRNYAHSIAFSCHNERETETVVTIKQLLNDGNVHYEVPEVYVQVILELISQARLDAILNICHNAGIPVTLLGYKSFGFGKDYEPKYVKAPEDWIEAIKKSGCQVGCDSVIVARYYKELVAAGCDTRALTGREGKFSCYVDAVTQTIGPSSFTDQSEPLDLEVGDILEQYKKY